MSILNRVLALFTNKSLDEVASDMLMFGSKAISLISGEKDLKPYELVNQIPTANAVEIDTVIKNHIREEVNTRVLEVLKEQLFAKYSLQELYALIIIKLSRIVKCVLSPLACVLKGGTNEDRTSDSGRKDIKIQNNIKAEFV